MNKLPFQIKICGVTTPADAQMAVRAGADAIGLNFYSRSQRFVPLDQAAAIAEAIPPGITKVGVFVNASLDEISAAISAASLDLVQLHGDEPPEFLKQIRNHRSIPMMRAFRWGADGRSMVDDYLGRCAALASLPDIVLIDSQTAGEFGGTGVAADWQQIARWREECLDSIPVVLAGGLTPENVAAAIHTVKPAAVDTASGVESSPGRKDPALVQSFVSAARKALTGSMS